MYPNNVLQVPD